MDDWVRSNETRYRLSTPKKSLQIFQNIKNVNEYRSLYVQTDILLLDDVFNNFISLCLTIYQLDPAILLPALGFS